MVTDYVLTFMLLNVNFILTKGLSVHIGLPLTDHEIYIPDIHAQLIAGWISVPGR